MTTPLSPASQTAEPVQENRERVMKIDAVPLTAERLKVEAYCRVSTLMERQGGSIRAQRRHYEKTIRANPEWEFAGVYIETGVTGTKAEIRPVLSRVLRKFVLNRLDCLPPDRASAVKGALHLSCP